MQIGNLSSDKFAHNQAELETEIGIRCADIPKALYRVREDALQPWQDVPTMQGKFVSAAFCAMLMGDADWYRMSSEDTQLAQAFFQPVLAEEGGAKKHPVAAALCKPDARICRPLFVGGTEGVIRGMWPRRGEMDRDDKELVRENVEVVLRLLECGAVRSAEPGSDGWVVQEWVKQAILLAFPTHQNMLMSSPHGHDALAFDKIPLLGESWQDRAAECARRRIRIVPPGTVRAGAYLGPGVVVMPGYVNMGAFVGDGTMVDTGARVGSCAQIGKNVHLSGGAGIGGVLEPPQASPTIVEDGAFIGACCEVAEGVIVRKRAVLSMGVYIGKNTPILDTTKSGWKSHQDMVIRGEVPENAVVMMGVNPWNNRICPHIVKYRDEKTDAATILNELLREG